MVRSAVQMAAVFVRQVGPAAEPLIVRRTGGSAATMDHIVMQVSMTCYDGTTSVIKLSHGEVSTA